jgi:hypothetical protein
LTVCERERALVIGNRLSVLALLGQHRSACGDDAPVGVRRIIRDAQQLLGQVDLTEVERKTSVFARQLPALAVEDGDLLEHRERPLLLAHGLEVASEVERRLEVAGVRRVLLAPIVRGLLQFVLRLRGALFERGRLGLGLGAVERQRVGSAGEMGAAAGHQARRKAKQACGAA